MSLRSVLCVDICIVCFTEQMGNIETVAWRPVASLAEVALGKLGGDPSSIILEKVNGRL